MDRLLKDCIYWDINTGHTGWGPLTRSAYSQFACVNYLLPSILCTDKHAVVAAQAQGTADGALEEVWESLAPASRLHTCSRIDAGTSPELTSAALRYALLAYQEPVNKLLNKVRDTYGPLSG